MSKIRVNVNICGNDYVILSDESESYVRTIASEVDSEINNALKSNIRKSMVKASIIVSMNYCDKIKKLKDEMEVYLKTIEEDQREIQRLKSEVSDLHMKIEDMKKNRNK